MSRSVQAPDYRRPTQPKFRIEWCGNLQVHVPIKESK